jgi:hypothetical protein
MITDSLRDAPNAAFFEYSINTKEKRMSNTINGTSLQPGAPAQAEGASAGAQRERLEDILSQFRRLDATAAASANTLSLPVALPTVAYNLIANSTSANRPISAISTTVGNKGGVSTAYAFQLREDARTGKQFVMVASASGGGGSASTSMISVPLDKFATYCEKKGITNAPKYT